jgi:hypothetical protein
VPYAAALSVHPLATHATGEVVGDVLDFSTGVGDDDAMQFTTSEQSSAIEHLVSSRSIIGNTGGAELEVTGGIEKPIVPTNIQVKVQSAFGANGARPLQIGQEVLFVQRGGRSVRALSIADADYFNAPDVAIMSEHITAPGLIEMDYQALPDQVQKVLNNLGVAEAEFAACDRVRTARAVKSLLAGCENRDSTALVGGPAPKADRWFDTSE